jgi:hypothetical protein
MLLQKLKDYRKAHKMLMRAAKADPKNPQVCEEDGCYGCCRLEELPQHT